jgi:hypothetical protein
MKRARSFLAAALVMFFSATVGYSFDIAIYKDPLSYWNERILTCSRFDSNRTDSACFAYWRSQYNPEQMASVYEWYRDMGVTKVMVIYPYADDFDKIPQDSSDIKVLNWYMPGLRDMHGMKYVDSQFREVHVGDVDPQFWSFDNSFGSAARRTEYRPSPQVDQRPVVAIDSGSAAPLWLPTSFLGSFSGWDWYTEGWLDSSIYMPLHYRLTWAVDPNGPVDETTEFADFYWIVQIPEERRTGDEVWWQFPRKSLTVEQPADTIDWIVSNFYEDARSGYYHKLDANFTVLDSVPWYEVYSEPSNPPRPLDDIPWNQIAYGQSDVRMKVQYRGTHSFYLNRIEVFDEAYWRMFVSGDSVAYQDTLWKAFRDEYNHPSGKSGGWYYDEWNKWGEPLKSIVKVNKLLQTHGLPTFYINGYNSYGDDLYVNGAPYQFRNEFMSLLHDESVHMSAHMDEFYPFGGDSGCTPDNAGEWPTKFMKTSTSSDSDYLTIGVSSDSCAESDQNVQGCGSCDWHPYEGVQSLQCALNGYLGPNDLRDYVAATHSTLCLYHCPDGVQFTSPVEQVKFAHDNGQQFWSLVQGGADWGNEHDPAYRFMLRDPTPNEVKLNAWLAVACDVDGIMWYPWDFGGLIDVNGTTFERNDRYWGAQDACTKIQRIASILEPLKFVKTYASRAFETDYPDSTYDATSRDILAINCWWSSQPFRSVQSIASYAQGEGNNWDVEDENPYVQVSRFRGRLFEEGDPTREDYWFLIVNRRALPEEARKVRITVEIDTAFVMSPYWLEYMLEDTLRLAEPCGQLDYDCRTRWIDVTLQPGGAELVHFYRGQWGCDEDLQVDIVQELTVHLAGTDAIRLRWAPVQGTGIYYVCKSINSEGPWAPFAATTDTTYVDSTYFPDQRKLFYAVQACFE